LTTWLLLLNVVRSVKQQASHAGLGHGSKASDVAS